MYRFVFNTKIIKYECMHIFRAVNIWMNKPLQSYFAAVIIDFWFMNSVTDYFRGPRPPPMFSVRWGQAQHQYTVFIDYF